MSSAETSKADWWLYEGHWVIFIPDNFVVGDRVLIHISGGLQLKRILIKLGKPVDIAIHYCRTY